MEKGKWQRWLNKRKGYWWWVPDVTKLSDRSIVEGIVNLGRWSDFLTLKKAWGIKKLHKSYRAVARGKRSNLRPEKRALFKNYFAKYAGSTH